MPNLRIFEPYLENTIFIFEIFKFVLLDWNFKKTIVTFEISTLEFRLNPKFHEKIKILKFGTKNILFGDFRAGIWKKYCHI